MSRGFRAGLPTKTDFRAKVATHYDPVPDWIAALADYATTFSAVLAAEKIGYSPPVVSSVFSKTYKGNLAVVEGKVRGALMGATVICPVLGEIGRDQCLDEQKKPFFATSSIRAKVYRACRSGCPHSRIKPEGDR